MSLQVLAYNLKRVINILGVEGLVRALYALFLLCFFPAWAIERNARLNKVIDSPII